MAKQEYKQVKCTNSLCQRGKVPCKDGFLDSHPINVRTIVVRTKNGPVKKILSDKCAGGTKCPTCKGNKTIRVPK